MRNAVIWRLFKCVAENKISSGLIMTNTPSRINEILSSKDKNKSEQKPKNNSDEQVAMIVATTTTN